MKIVSNKDDNGKVVYNDNILYDIVSCALTEVDGVVMFAPQTKQSKRCVSLEQMPDGTVNVAVFVKMNYNVSVSEVASQIQSSIKNAIETNTEFKVHSVDVHVVEVEFGDNN